MNKIEKIIITRNQKKLYERYIVYNIAALLWIRENKLNISYYRILPKVVTTIENGPRKPQNRNEIKRTFFSTDHNIILQKLNNNKKKFFTHR